MKEVAGAPGPQLLGVLRELGNLKRVRSAGRPGSIAERLFTAAWSGLLGGRPVEEVWRQTTAEALAASRLGDLDHAALRAVGLSHDETQEVLLLGLREAATNIDERIVQQLIASMQGDRSFEGHPLPPFVGQLAAQPRAGATSPGHPRLLFEPPESHAEHCLMVAVYGVLVSPTWGAKPATVFLAGLSHHLHNALLPDSGFVGEVLLGEALEPACTRATEQALADLPPELAAKVRISREILLAADTPEGRAFHAADTLDRVLQVEHHLRAARTTLDFVLDDMELIHAGAVRPFQLTVIAAMGLSR